MSYEKQTWATGDIVTADKLNHMEDGIAAGGGSVFDAKIKVTVPANSYDPWVCEIVSGTYVALDAMLQDGTSPCVLVCQFNEANTRGYCSAMTFVQPGEEGVLSIFYVISYENGNPVFEYHYLIWNDDDTIELD